MNSLPKGCTDVVEILFVVVSCEVFGPSSTASEIWPLGPCFQTCFFPSRSMGIWSKMMTVHIFHFWGGKKTTNWNSTLYHQLLNIVLFFLSIILANFGRPGYVTDGCFLWECNFSGVLVTVCLPPFGMSLFSSNYSNLSKYHQLALQKKLVYHFFAGNCDWFYG